MRLGISLPQFGDDADDARRIGEFAAAAERAGAASLWVGDRLLAAREPSVGYRGGDTVPVEFRRALDPFIALGLAAAATRSATLGASVLVGPLYPPAVLARSLMTISAVAGDRPPQGRLVTGLGIGWSPEEYAGAKVPFDRRGARLDALLDGLDELWTADGPTHVQIPRPRPAVYLSAFAPAALARVGRRADGWLPVAVVGSDHDRVGSGLKAARACIDAAARAAGRDPARIDTVLRVNVPATATLEDVTVAVRDLAAVTGFEHLFVDLMYRHQEFDERLAALERLLGAV